jgi:hypothetical protein
MVLFCACGSDWASPRRDPVALALAAEFWVYLCLYHFEQTGFFLFLTIKNPGGPRLGIRKHPRSHLINAAAQRKRQDLGDETVETQPNHHFPSVPVVQVLWHSCHETIYEISSS